MTEILQPSCTTLTALHSCNKHTINKSHSQDDLWGKGAGCWENVKKLHAAHLHSLLRRLIWSVTKLCSRNETSGLLMASSPGSLKAANSMTQWTKAKVKRRSVRASVWACCKRKEQIKYCEYLNCSCGIWICLFYVDLQMYIMSVTKRPGRLTSQYHHCICLYLHQCILRELWRVKERTAVWRCVHCFSLTVSTASSLEKSTI